MSYVFASPEMMATAAADFERIGAALASGNAAAAGPTTSLVTAAGDEVSAAIAGLFSEHAHDYQALAGRAAAFHEQFVRALSGASRPPGRRKVVAAR
jgi:hypothetical protein